MDVRGIGRKLGRWGLGGSLAFALLAASMLTPANAGAVRSEMFGIVQGDTLGARDLHGLTRARIRTDRFMLNWGWVQPTSQGSFNWTGPDRLIGELASHGIRAVPALWGNPQWVSGPPARPPIDRPLSVQAWAMFLKAAVARYGPGGGFWRNKYRHEYGANATPVPIQSWQIWNEPNLSKYFSPSPSAQRYGRLLQISHNAITSKDANARIVLAGMPGFGEVRAWDFLRNLYSVPGVKGYFDAAALHPYARDLTQFRQEIGRFRAVMRNHGDWPTPLWITELAWGSAPPDRFGINKGLEGQERMLRSAFGLILRNRDAWNVQRLFWFHWRDPRATQQSSCSFCGSAGLIKHNRIPKPALATFRSFTAETTPPQATITSGPSEGEAINDRTPTFEFSSSEPGSTFQCRFGIHNYAPCDSPFTAASPLSDGPRTFSVRAIDAPGNVGVAASRSFTVDRVPPTVRITAGPANGATSANRTPTFRFVANEAGASFECQLNSRGFAPCSSPHTTHRLDNGEHLFEVRATDPAGNTGPAKARRWTVDAPAPTVQMSSGPADGSTTSDPSPSFRFSSPEAAARFECKLDSNAFGPCSSPHATQRLRDGRHVFGIRAVDAAHNKGTPLEIGFTVDTARPRLRIEGPRKVKTRARRASATFVLRASEQVGLRCRIASRHFEPCTRRYRTPRLAGPHTLKVKATDAAGNVTARRKPFRIVSKARARARRDGTWWRGVADGASY